MQSLIPGFPGRFGPKKIYFGRNRSSESTLYHLALDLSYLWAMMNLRRLSLGQHTTVLHTDTIFGSTIRTSHRSRIASCSMTVRRLKSHLHIVACGHDFITWWPLIAHTASNRLPDSFKTLAVSSGGRTYLQQYVRVSAKEEGERVAPFTRAVCHAVHRALENVICTVYMDVIIMISQRRGDALVHLANWPPKLQSAFFRTGIWED